MTRVCIIGAGASGLPAIKACIEKNLEVICYEKTSELGGLWNYRPGKNVGATVMGSTVVNTSKEMMCYSDFPPPDSWPNFMHHSLVLQYMKDYAEKFDLLKYINFNTAVEAAEKEGDKWRIKLSNGKSELFDKLMLCTGHHSIPVFPQLRGIENFKGKCLHAHEYTDYKGFEGKNIFIVGIGNSALDIAVELAKISKSVTVSTRRGSWIFNRCAQGGMPYDIIFHSRLYSFIRNVLPMGIVNDFMEHRLQQRMDHDLYGLRPNHRFFEQHPTVNDALCNLLSSGHVVITEDVETFEEKSVIVKGGKRFPCDYLILCTGYTFDFPFVKPKEIIPIKDHSVNLYKFVFPLDDPSLAIIGLIQPIGSIAPISEIQSRWVAGVFAEKYRLPSRTIMQEDIDKKSFDMKKRYFSSPKHTLQVDFIPYMDELAELVGCRPDIKKIFFTDFKFFLRLFLGANAPYVYRLVGPDRWSGAREALYSLPARVKLPLKNRQCRMRKHKKRGTVDEYFRYSSMKFLAMAFTFILLSGFFGLCLTPEGMSVLAFMSYLLVFSFCFSFVLLWFDLQYDMSTIF
ncbi:hypothetical protein FO519_007609 [Halicephalobus sp. NKZ332]|nr:hypothetical protein FO519_007609 [Halicephalobus sp. NKZ332]